MGGGGSGLGPRAVLDDAVCVDEGGKSFFGFFFAGFVDVFFNFSPGRPISVIGGGAFAFGGLLPQVLQISTNVYLVNKSTCNN